MITATQILIDIEFAEDNIQEFIGHSGGAGIAPMLRYVAAINPDVDREVFIAAAVSKGYKATTAKTCFYVGRKWARDNS